MDRRVARTRLADLVRTVAKVRPWRGSWRVAVNRLADLIEAHRSISIIVGMTVAATVLYLLPLYPPLSLFQPQRVWLDSFANAGVFVLLALGLNVVVGLAGLLDLGYAAFFAIGAYTYAFADSPFSGNHFPFLPMLFVGAVVAAIFGIILGAPTLRLRGDYLAIMTLGFGEIVPIVFLNAEPYTQGTNGIGGVYRPDPLPFIGAFNALSSFPYFALMVGIVTIVMILLYRLQDSRIGRAWMAIREDELAAAANGINTVTTKLLAFALGASTSGFAGVFAASKLTIVSPDQFLFTVSFTVLAMVVLGGMGNIWGVATGAFVIFIIQTVFLKQLNAFKDAVAAAINVPPVQQFLAGLNFIEYQFLLYGVALVAMMLLRPEGLFPSRRRRLELHAAEEATGAEEAVGGETAASLESGLAEDVPTGTAGGGGGR
jgi:ABC-type branched-subunit amino acid transport system permease subunit